MNTINKATFGYGADNLSADKLKSLLEQGIKSQQQGDLVAAADFYNKVLHHASNNVDALNLLGLVALQQRDYEQAIKLIDQAIAEAPNFPSPYCNKASAMKALGRFEDAFFNYDKALALDPNLSDAHFNKANLLMQLKQYPLAIEHYERTVAIRPYHAASWFCLASAQSAVKQHNSAIHSYQQVLTLQPDRSDAYFCMGGELVQLGRFEAAVICYERSVAIKPDYAEAYLNLGIVYARLNRLEEALHSYSVAIRINPDMPQAYSNKGIVLRKLNNALASIDCHDKAIQLAPDYVEAYINKGVAHLDLHEYEAAIRCYQHAIKLQPSNPEAHWNMAIAFLVSGQWQLGWLYYEWRWEKSGVSLHPLIKDHPVWKGDRGIADKTIFLHCEQGLGDTIQFYRYVKAVADIAGKVIVEVQPTLVNLFSALDPRVIVLAKGSQVPAFDYYCPLLSLPMAFNTTINSIPSTFRYLNVEEEKVQQWFHWIGKKKKPRIGLVWSGSSTHTNDHNRSIPLSALLPILPEQFDYFCLQKELRYEDAEILAKQSRIKFVGGKLHDFTDTAALCELMDLVISVDTSVAHVCGALGKATWLLLPFNPDWRWQLSGSNCIWYDSMTLYRQSQPGDWLSILKNVSQDLGSYPFNLAGMDNM